MTHPLEQYWECLSPTAREVLSIAYSHSKEQGGKGRLRTRYVTAALRTRPSEPLGKLLSEIPDQALPDPVPVGSDPDVHPRSEIRPELSPCVRDTLTALGAACTKDQQITSLDLFVDLVKHGGGSTVSRLRAHGVSASQVDEWLDRLFDEQPVTVMRTDRETPGVGSS